ncbi:DgyrCDS3106 [Dimorphilus gyrociliatus]|nr:DgyrCDS3106 [Dimorphilus gyrociliatus]
MPNVSIKGSNMKFSSCQNDSIHFDFPYNRKFECRSEVNGSFFDSDANGNLLLLMTVDNLDSQISSVYYCVRYLKVNGTWFLSFNIQDKLNGNACLYGHNFYSSELSKYSAIKLDEESSLLTTSIYETTRRKISTHAEIESTASQQPEAETTTLHVAVKTSISTVYIDDTTYSLYNQSTPVLVRSTPPFFWKPSTTASSDLPPSQIAAIVFISLLGLIIIALLAKGFSEWWRHCQSKTSKRDNISSNNFIESVEFTETSRQDADGNAGEAEQTELTWEIGGKDGTNFPTFPKAFYIQHKKQADPTSLNTGLYDSQDSSAIYY